MRINTNIAAMSAQRNLWIASSQNAKSIERLSSGLRINRAADDAAGLSISEKMRGQIRGLTQAAKNAQDGISLLQTAEGALNEAHSILQRMNELGLQGANGTLSVDDRQAVVSELTGLRSELDRIANVTEFNGKKLLQGSPAHVDTTASPVTVTAPIWMPGYDTATADTATVTIAPGTYTNTSYQVQVTGTTGSPPLIEWIAVSTDNWVTWQGFHLTPGPTSSAMIAPGITINFTNAPTVNNASQIYSFTTSGGVAPGPSIAQTVDLQIGANTTSKERLAVRLRPVSTDAIGTVSGGPASLSAAVEDLADNDPTAADFRALVDSVQVAVKDVSSNRSSLGAAQNRLEHTIANLGVVSENLSSSESRIRDLDMAAEVVAMTKTQVLTQAGMAILAQANQQPQSVLSLLR